MRMEAKNAVIKRAAQAGHFKNIAYSVAKRHQRLLCTYLQGQFFEKSLECEPGKYTYTSHMKFILYCHNNEMF